MSDENFECGICHGVFRKDPEWTEEQALAEYKRSFGQEKPPDAARVCGSCYNKVMATLTN